MPTAKISISTSNPRIKNILQALLSSGLEAGNPEKAMKRMITIKGSRLCVNKVDYDLATFNRVVCVGAGKASAHMALTLEQIVGNHLKGGLVIVKDGYGSPTKNIRIIEASHPLPDQRGVRATRHILSLVQSLTKQDLLIVLLSGGASSLLCAPACGLTLTNKRRATNLLLRCGATIHELNTVRKHLSAIKGGQLAKATSANILTLIISDVLGDDLATIGSGPTAPDPTTFQEAKDILQHCKIWTKIPQAVQDHLEQGIHGQVPETLKRKNRISRRIHHVVLANNRHSIDAVAKKAKGIGLHPFIIPTPLQGEATTVTVTGTGMGGRAQECVLAAAEELAGLRHVVVAGFGTDGTDGPTEVAGVVVDGNTMKRAQKMGVDPRKMLAANDSYTFFKKVGGHIRTGPTGTNVNDIYLVLAL
jgi:hydroxypyruvate reductase